MLDILQLNDMLVPELRELAENMGLSGYKRLNKQELIHKILDHQAVVGATQGRAAIEDKTESDKAPKSKEKSGRRSSSSRRSRSSRKEQADETDNGKTEEVATQEADGDADEKSSRRNSRRTASARRTRSRRRDDADDKKDTDTGADTAEHPFILAHPL